MTTLAESDTATWVLGIVASISSDIVPLIKAALGAP